MKELKMFMFEGCPHCKRAEEMISELLARHPEYKEVPFVMIDEKKEPEVADKYDYYYVPTFLSAARRSPREFPPKRVWKRHSARHIKDRRGELEER